MFIASTVNPMSMSKIDVPVVVLTYGKESELVEVPVAYKVCLFSYSPHVPLIMLFHAAFERLGHARFWN